MVTWISAYDDIDKISDNVHEEFKNVNENISDVVIANHQHKKLPYNFNLDGSVTSTDLDASNLIDKMPVGSLFYWPRAFLVDDKTISNCNISSKSDLRNKYKDLRLTTFNPETENQKYKSSYKLNKSNLSDSAGKYFGLSGITLAPNKQTFARNLIPFVSGAIPFDNTRR
jgi:hypothetical protein